MKRINTSTELVTGDRFRPNSHYRRSRARTPSNGEITETCHLSPPVGASHAAAVAVVRHILGGTVIRETNT
jgi:hypothetical protein